MKTTPFRRVVLNIHVNTHEQIAAHVLDTARRWRCNRLMVIVAAGGEVRCADINIGRNQPDPDPSDIIGTFGYDSMIEDIEDAVIEQKRQMTAHLQVAA